MQYRSHVGIEIDFHQNKDSYGLFSSVQVSELKRILSNLINNSVESINESGEVLVTISSDRTNSNIIIQIKDNGRGIPPELLNRLCNLGATFGKTTGSGIGLYHAKKSIESMGGQLLIDSEECKGTIITLQIPQSSVPTWFLSELQLPINSTVVILDDDSSIHQVWQERFEKAVPGEDLPNIIHLSTPQQLRNWVTENTETIKVTKLLVDYELIGFQETGLDLIKELNLKSNSILVTSRFEEQSILKNCQDLGIKLIPKSMAAFVPITITETKKYDAILIDDDDLVHATWQNSAKVKGRTLKTYFNPQHFFSEDKLIDPSSPIYVDANLGPDIFGDQIAADISNKGFEKVYLTTGYVASNFYHRGFLAGIIGKEPPF